jgi:hypothetical protein
LPFASAWPLIYSRQAHFANHYNEEKEMNAVNVSLFFFDIIVIPYFAGFVKVKPSRKSYRSSLSPKILKPNLVYV